MVHIVVEDRSWSENNILCKINTYGIDISFEQENSYSDMNSDIQSCMAFDYLVHSLTQMVCLSFSCATATCILAIYVEINRTSRWLGKPKPVD